MATGPRPLDRPDGVPSGVPERVLDLFAVPDDVRPLPGGQGGSVVAGDLVLSPGRDAATQDWLSPVLAGLAVTLDTEAPRTLRVAMPIPSRDGSWVVHGWAASRYEPDTTACTELDVLVATGRLLHGRLAVAVPERPAGLDARTDRWAEADRVAWGSVAQVREAVAAHGATRLAGLVDELDDAVGEDGPAGHPALGPDQLVHGDLAGNVLLDATGTPVVIDLAPYWRPALWAEAVCVLDAVLWHRADPRVLEPWRRGVQQQAMLRAAVFRLLSEEPGSGTAGALARVLDPSPLRVL